MGNFIGKIEPAADKVTLKAPPTPNSRPYGLRMKSKGILFYCEFNSTNWQASTRKHLKFESLYYRMRAPGRAASPLHKTTACTMPTMRAATWDAWMIASRGVNTVGIVRMDVRQQKGDP